MNERIEELRAQFQQGIDAAPNLEALEKLRVKFLGKKGEVTTLMRGMGKLPADERPLFGKLLNEFKGFAEKMLDNQKKQLKEKDASQRWEKERLDITLPGKPFHLGRKHPLTVITEEIEEIFSYMGFQIAEGPEVESDYYNFEALNMSKEHPARDMQDSFYINPEVLLRTHTSPMQVRTMEAMAPGLPVRIICPGKVFRRDDDVTHSPMFHQVEGLVVDRGVSLADLKGILMLFTKEMFGEGRELRFRPSFFPFTEPSAEVDISCIICGGSGCRTCGDTGWLEILGSGMVHPRVLEVSGYDSEEVTGYAFGIGIERIAMLKYGIDDIRLFYYNDLRMLQQY
ncbi:MAG TPA: phenylalanine--tRNA ligase subunit alpha [Firmicutes bacterium]|nr:phenylalanine--tRNA ligase subunit alpha [Bacillota bacterium]